MRTTPEPQVDITQIFPELAAMAKQTVRLHPRRGPEPGIRESKMGGLFLWPADEPSPVCIVPESPLGIDERQPQYADHPGHNDNFVSVLQLRAEDFPELEFPEDKNLFQLLWCPRDHPSAFTVDCKVYWRKEEEITQPLNQLPTPKNPNKDYLPETCCIHPERVIEYPSIRELSEEFLRKIQISEAERQDDNLYHYELSTAPGTKIGGYVNWIQDPEVPICDSGHEMKHLLTIDSIEVNDSPNSRWLAIEDQDALTRPYQERNAIIRAANLMLGDMGSIYLFICRGCEGWPIAWIFQCS